MREAAQLIAAGNEVMIEKKFPPEWKNEQGRKRHPKKKLQ